MTYVVIVQRTPLQRDVYGPYRSFKAADGDAKAWGGTVEPVMKPAAHDSSEGKLMTANNQLIAIEIEGQPFALGVQWHPESMFFTSPCMRELFSLFVRSMLPGTD